MLVMLTEAQRKILIDVVIDERKTSVGPKRVSILGEVLEELYEPHMGFVPSAFREQYPSGIDDYLVEGAYLAQRRVETVRFLSNATAYEAQYYVRRMYFLNGSGEYNPRGWG